MAEVEENSTGELIFKAFLPWNLLLMSTTLFLPNLKAVSTRDQIILVLFHAWPLTAKQLHARIAKENASNVSYQAVHKTINSLVSEKVLERLGSGYRLNEAWIKGVKGLVDGLGDSYSGKVSEMQLASLDKPIFLTFENLGSVGVFLVNEFYGGKFSNPEKKDATCLWRHTWPVGVGMSEKEYNHLLKAFQECRHLGVTKENTFLDRYFSDFLEKMGKLTVNNANFSAHEDTFLQGDFVAQVYMPTDVKEEMHGIYLKVKNAELANKIRKEGNELFEKRKVKT